MLQGFEEQQQHQPPHLTPISLCCQLHAVQVNKQRRQQVQVLDEQGNDISEFLVEPEGASAAAGQPGSKRAATDSGYVSSSEEEDATVAVEGDDGAAAGEDATAAAAAERRRPQLIFCSRTHSQLSQFVGELHRTRFADSVMLVAVGSRRNLCVNDEVRRAGTAACSQIGGLSFRGTAGKPLRSSFHSSHTLYSPVDTVNVFLF
jgi:hypothetical protein